MSIRVARKKHIELRLWVAIEKLLLLGTATARSFPETSRPLSPEYLPLLLFLAFLLNLVLRAWDSQHKGIIVFPP